MRTLYTIRQFTAQQPAFSEGSLRWLIFHAEDNGLLAAGAILRNGRRVLIDGERFLKWLDSRQQRVA